jgi:hypothetical protein
VADATLQTIRAAIRAQLDTLNGTPFAHIGDWAGEVNAQRVDLQALGNTPSAQLAFAGEDYDPTKISQTVALGQAQWVGRSHWLVYVTATDERSTPEVAADAAATGILACLTSVTGALAGLPISGLWQQKRLALVSVRPRFVRSGIYVYVVQCDAERAIVSTPTASVAQTLDEIRGNANMTGTPDPDPNFYVPGKVVF